MKFLPALLLNVLAVGAGILLYDALRAEPDASGAAPLSVDASAGLPAAGLTGSADRQLAHSTEARMRGIEAAIAKLQAELERVRSGKGAGDSASEEATGPVQIDERTLHWMTAYRQEILKREGEARIRARMAEEFRRKGVDLSDDLMQKVVRETLAFHARAKALMRKPVERSAEGFAERTRAVRELRNGYETILVGLVASDQVERILSTRVGRAHDILPDDDD